MLNPALWLRKTYRLFGLLLLLLAISFAFSPAFAQTPTPKLQGKFCNNPGQTGCTTMSDDVLAGASGVYQDVQGDVHLSGNLGIGTTEPSQKFDLWGPGLIEGLNGFGAGSPQATLYLGNTGKYLQANYGGATTLRSDDPILFQVGNNSNQLYLKTTGEVGIATNFPGYKLEVNGDGRINQILYVGAEGARLDGSSEGGSLELGPANGSAASRTPYLDFHYGPAVPAQDYSARIVNIGDGELDFLSWPTWAGSSSTLLSLFRDQVYGNTVNISGKIDVAGPASSNNGFYAFPSNWGSDYASFSYDGTTTKIYTPGGKPIYMDGAVGIGTSSPGTFQLNVSGDANATRICIAGNCQAAWPTATIGPGTPNKVSKFITASTIGDSQIFDNGTNVGIGTASPNKMTYSNKVLTISNTSYPGLEFYPTSPGSGGNLGQISFVEGTATTGGAAAISSWLDSGVTTNAYLAFHAGNGMTGGTLPSERMRITSAGNIGIGTANPGAKLDVPGNVYSQFGGLRLNGLDNSVNQIWQSNTGYVLGITGNNAGLSLGGATSQQHLFINASGNVGIGDIDPTEAKTVIRSAAGSDNLLYLSNSAASITGTALDIQMGQYADTYNAIRVNSGSNVFVVKGGGNVGIGTTGPGAKLHIVSTVDNTAGSNQALQFNGLYGFRVDAGTYTDLHLDRYYGGAWQTPFMSFQRNTGNVGIGTTGPLDKLHVNGARSRLNNILVGEIGSNFDIIQGGSSAGLRLSAVGTAITLEPAGTEVMRLVSGNVGIGTTNPTVKLVVTTGGATANPDGNSQIWNARTGGLAMIGTEDVSNAMKTAMFSGQFGSGEGGAIGTLSSHKLHLITGGANPRLTIDTSGNVGIGTTGPGYTLDVLTTAQQGLRLQRATGATNLRIDAISGDSAIQLGDGATLGATSAWTIGRDNTDNSFRFANSDALGTTDRVTITTEGNVGIGTITPAAKAQINPPVSTEGLRIVSASDWSPLNIRNSANSADIFRVNETGTLAVGTVPWVRLGSFPSACPASQYVTAVGSTLTCSTPAGASSVRWDQIQNPAFSTGLNLDMTNTQTAFRWTSSVSGGGGTLLQLSDTTIDTNWGYLLNLITSSQSLVRPLHVSAKGKDAILVNSNAAVGIGTTTLPSNAILSVNNRTTSPPAIFVDDTGTVGIGSTDTNANGQKFSVGGAPGTSPGFQIDPWGNVRRINGVAYSWPSSQGAAGTQLTNNDGSGSLTWGAASDRRLKENIQGLQDGLATLRQINPVSFELNGKGGMQKGSKGIGIVAQEVKDIIPYTISTFKAKLNPEDQAETELYTFNQNPLTFVTINAVKELDIKMANQEAKIKALEETVQKQQTKTGQLENEIRLLQQAIESLKYSR